MIIKLYQLTRLHVKDRAPFLILLVLLIGWAALEASAQSVSNTTYTVNDGAGSGTGEYIRNLKYSSGPDWGMSFYVGNTKRMTIRGGNVGIGTENPIQALHVVGTITTRDASNYFIDIGVNGGNPFFTTSGSGGDWVFKRGADRTGLGITTAGNVYLAIGGEQKVSIGMTTAETTLDVAGTMRARNSATTSNFLEIGHGGTNAWLNRSGGGLQFRNAGTTQMVLSSDGKLGLNLTSPAAPIDVNGAVRSRALISDPNAPSTAYAEIGNDGSDSYLNGSASLLNLNVQGTPRMTLNQEGNVGIGTITPAYKLDVNGTLNATGINVDGSPLDVVIEGVMEDNFVALDGNYLRKVTHPDGTNTVVFGTDPKAWRLSAQSSANDAAFSIGYEKQQDSNDYFNLFTINQTSSGTTVDLRPFDWLYGKSSMINLGDNNFIQGQIYDGIIINSVEQVGLKSGNQQLWITGQRTTNTGDFNNAGDFSVSYPGAQVSAGETSYPSYIKLGVGQDQQHLAKLSYKVTGVNSNFAIHDETLNRDVMVFNDAYVGINTSTPTTRLDVNGTINGTDFTLNGDPLVPWVRDPHDDLHYNEGNVGIGTPNPTGTLHVVGDILLQPINWGSGSSTTTLKMGDNGHEIGIKWNEGISIQDKKTITMKVGGDDENRTQIMRLEETDITVGSDLHAMNMKVFGSIDATNLTVGGLPVTGTSTSWIKASDNRLYYNDGNIGIGTSDPSSLLHLRNTNGAAQIQLENWDGNQSSTRSAFVLEANYTTLPNQPEYFKIGRNSNTVVREDIYITGGGKVGIGKRPGDQTGNDCNCQLDVNGAVNATEFLVNGQQLSSWTKDQDNNLTFTGGYVYISGDVNAKPAQSNFKNGLLDKYSLFVEEGVLAGDFAMAPVNAWWADYVFEKDYKLKSLVEVESFIKDNKHLPNVPSQAHIAKNGYSVHDMNVIMMEKIEELTLYLIQQEKKIEVLEAKLVAQGNSK